MADFKTCCIKDGIISGITDKLTFAVMSGAANNTYQQFQAVTATSSSIVYNIQIPSESIIIGREVLQQSLVTWQLAISGVPLGASAFSYGQTDSVQSFPLNSLYNTCTATINNTNVNVNLQDVKDVLVRLNNSRELYRYNSMTAVLPDQAYLKYSDGAEATNNPLSGWNNSSFDVDLNPRGSFPLSRCEVARYTNAGYQDTNVIAQGDAGERWVITMAARFTEPLFLSPFIFGEPEYNKSGFAGINTMNFVFNVDASMKRFFSTANNYTYVISGGALATPLVATATPMFQDTRMLLHFLSAQPTDLIPSRIVTPYMDYPRYLSLSNLSVPIPSGASATLTSQNIQLNQLPDYFFIVVRKPMATQTIKDSASFLTINNISVNLNNQSGLLSSSTAVDLWKCSQINGSTQSWAEFSGLAQSASAVAAVGSPTVNYTTGSILILSPALQLSLPSFLSSSSIGQFNFQFNINVTNRYPDAVAPEIMVCCANSGIFVSQMGSLNAWGVNVLPKVRQVVECY